MPILGPVLKQEKTVPTSKELTAERENKQGDTSTELGLQIGVDSCQAEKSRISITGRRNSMYKIHSEMGQCRESRGWKELQKMRLESQTETSRGGY